MTAAASKHYVEALTGIRVSMPKVSGVVFKEQVAALRFVALEKARAEVEPASVAPWLTVGVVARKEVATSAGGGAYSRWLLSDLRRGELRLVLFGDAHAAHKGVPEGAIVAVMGGVSSSSGRGGGGQQQQQYSSLAVADARALQHLATAAGFGFCEGVTKAGERCRRCVDKAASPFCEWHALSQQRRVRQDLRGSAAVGAVAAAAAGATSGGTAAGGAFRGGGITAGGGLGGSSCGGLGSGGGGEGVGFRGVAILPGAPDQRPGALLQQMSAAARGAGGAGAGALTHQERERRRAEAALANRQRLAEQIRQRGGLPARDPNRTRPPSPPRGGGSGSGGGGGGGSGGGSGGAAGPTVRPRLSRGPTTPAVAAGAAAGGAMAPAAATAAAAQPRSAGGNNGSGKARASAAGGKIDKLRSGLGIAPRAGAPTPQQLGAGAGRAAPPGASSSSTAKPAGVPGGAAAAAAAAPAPGSAAAQFARAFGGVATKAAAKEDEDER